MYVVKSAIEWPKKLSSEGNKRRIRELKGTYGTFIISMQDD